MLTALKEPARSPTDPFSSHSWHRDKAVFEDHAFESKMALILVHLGGKL